MHSDAVSLAEHKPRLQDCVHVACVALGCSFRMVFSNAVSICD
jgi:hypothetical protein